jgi:hypothetical protein
MGIETISTRSITAKQEFARCNEEALVGLRF